MSNRLSLPIHYQERNGKPMAESSIPKSFIFRRLHSFTGLWLVGYLIFHLIANSQAALLIGEDGHGFIKAVNEIHNLPFLPVLEVIVLGIPIFIHMLWGIEYVRGANYNSFGTGDGKKPYLPEYPRNHAYTWQRITSWVLLFAIIAHVVHMRFIEHPVKAKEGSQTVYMVRLDADEGLPLVAETLHVQLFDQERVQIHKEKLKGDSNDQAHPLNTIIGSVVELFNQSPPNPIKQTDLSKERKKQEQHAYVEALETLPLKPGQVIAVAPDFGTAELLMVRETFKMPIMMVLYTLFVLSACYHGFNGLWTAMISWGVTLSQASQRLMRYICVTLMIGVSFLGLSAIWLTYWVNLK